MKPEHLRFIPCKDEDHYIVRSGRGYALGQIYRKARWKTFVFEPLDDTFWSPDCLEAVAAFLKKVNKREP